jgi:hypothetical protein
MQDGTPEKDQTSVTSGSSSAPQRDRPPFTVEELRRWEEHGATWRAVELSDAGAVVELCTCYGEPVDIVRGDAPELIAFVRAHRDY